MGLIQTPTQIVKHLIKGHLLVDEGADLLLHLLVLVPHHPATLLHLLQTAHLVGED